MKYNVFLIIFISNKTANSQEELLRMVETQAEIIQQFKDECNTVKEKSLSNQQVQGYDFHDFIFDFYNY